MSERYDLLISGGSVIDGTGAPMREADIGIREGLIAAVGRNLGQGADEIDARGLLVTPGFVDVHTHFDGQLTWDSQLDPSFSHGVTTIVAGNCGVGFAPVRPGREQDLIKLMEGVEDIPGAVLSEGIKWSWESFPEYMDAIGKRSFSMDVGTQIPHGALRAYAMGRNLAHPLEAGEAVIDPDDPGIGVEVVFARIEEPAIRRKGAVAEEVARLSGHLVQFDQVIAPNHSEPAGRTLDFLSQEMLREANTIASKSQDVEIARKVVEMKTAIDRIKEQAANAE
jgi:hypothetical protein